MPLSAPAHALSEAISGKRGEPFAITGAPQYDLIDSFGEAVMGDLTLMQIFLTISRRHEVIV